VTNLESGSIAGSYGNLIRSESRVGSPLEKIREGNFCTGGVEEVPPVWCLDCQENLVILGTGTGRVEIWDSFSGYLKVNYKSIFYLTIPTLGVVALCGGSRTG